MQTVPDAIALTAKAGTFAYALEINPRSGDSWSARRYGQLELAIDDDLYADGVLAGVSQIKNKANIRAGGAAVTKDSVRFSLINDSRLHEDLITDSILGREVKIYLAPISHNLILNGSFERYTAGPIFENWTKNTPGAGSGIGTSTGTHGTTSLTMLYGGTPPEPQIYTDDSTMKKGEYLSVSLDAKGLASGDKFEVAIYLGGLWWNFTTRSAGISIDWQDFTTTTAWDRYDIESLHWSEFGLADSTRTTTIRLYIRVAVNADQVFFDAVQAETYPDGRDYVPHPLDLLAANVIRFYTGEVKEYDWGRDLINIKTNSILDTSHKDIPSVLCTNAIDSAWNIPPDNDGKPFPMTYGLFFSYDIAELGQLPEYQLPFGMLCNWKEEAGNPVTVHFDRPGMKLYALDILAHYHEDSNKYFKEMHDDRTTPVYADYEWDKSADNGGRGTTDSSAGFLPAERLALSSYLHGYLIDGEYQNGGTPLFTTPENAFDGDSGTSATNSDAASSGAAWFDVFMESLGISKGEIIDAYALMNVVQTRSAGIVETILTTERADPQHGVANTIVTDAASFNNVPWALGADKETDKIYTKDATINNTAWWDSGGREVFSRVFWNLAGVATGTVAIKNIGIRVDVSVELLSANICAAVLAGREYQDTWGGRKTAANYIRNLADIIESILRHELDQTTAMINTTTFDDANTARSGWDYAGQVLGEVRDSEDVIDELCKNGGLMYYIDLDGKHALKALDHGVPDFTLKQRDFVRGSIKPGYTSRRDVANDFILSYDQNHLTGDFNKTLYCNKDGSNFTAGADQTEYEGKCATSYAALGDVEQRREFEAAWIHDKAEAEKLFKWLIDWNYLQRLTVKGNVYFNNAGIEIGDRGSLMIQDFIPETICLSSVFVVESVTVDRKTNTLALSMLEVKEP